MSQLVKAPLCFFFAIKEGWYIKANMQIFYLLLAMVALPSIAHFIFVALIGAYAVLLIDGLAGVVLLLVEAFRKKEKPHYLGSAFSF